MNPVRVSTSKSCAARVVVSTTPAGGPTRTSGRGSERKWLEESRAIGANVGCEMRNGDVEVSVYGNAEEVWKKK
jgi:hypothetical protein